MSDLSERLHSLGVRVGTRNLAAPKPRDQEEHPIEGVLPGDWWQTPQGDIFFTETRYKAEFKVGSVPLKPSSSFEIIAAYAQEPKITELDLEQFAFIDTETTGLAGGTGTYTFLVGIGRFEDEEYRLVQFFLQSPNEEPAQLAAIEEFLAPCEAVVSFNGKAFDLPLLNTRYITNGWPPPLKDTPHIDLLHLARRLWKLRLPSRSLGDLETEILGLTRSQQDVPGWMVADLYFDYLHTGDARPLRGVFYHNEMDIVSLAALLNKISGLLAKPLDGSIEHGLDLISIGKLYADLGHLNTAVNIYQRGLAHDDVQKDVYWNALQQLSFIHKKSGDHRKAIPLWEQAANDGQIYAHVELAKVYEHKERNIKAALMWTRNAINTISSSDYPAYERDIWQAELEHRLQRLERKINPYFEDINKTYRSK